LKNRLRLGIAAVFGELRGGFEWIVTGGHSRRGQTENDKQAQGEAASHVTSGLPFDPSYNGRGHDSTFPQLPTVLLIR
jgi:hypothetical protein